MVEKYEPYQILSNVTQKKKDALLVKNQKSYKELNSIKSIPERVSPDVSTSIFEELLTVSMKFYDDMEKNAINQKKYFPTVFRPDLEKKFQGILNNTEKVIIGSNSSLVELGLFAEYLRMNRSV